MKGVVTIACMVVLATSVMGDEGFSLKDTTTGKTHGPFQFKHGSKVTIGDTELTIVKPDPAQDKIVAMLKETKIPELDIRNAALSEIAEFLAKNADYPDISIVLGHGAARVDDITFLVRNTTLYDVLGILCDTANLEWEVRHGVVMIDLKVSEDAPVQKAESTVLRKALAETVAEMFELEAKMKQEKGDVSPPEMTKPNYVDLHMEAMKQRFPSLFMVSAREEARFKAGIFHDDDNTKRMKESLQKLEDYEAALPFVSLFLIQKLNDGNLEGAQLELATRLLSCLVDKAGAMAERTDAEQTSPADQTYTTYEVRSLTGWSLWRFRYEGGKSKIRLTLQNETHASSAVIDFTKASPTPEEVVLGIILRPDRRTVEYNCRHVWGSGSIGQGGELQFYQIGSCNSMELHNVGALGTEDARLVTLDVRSEGEDGGTVKVPVTIRLEN